MVAPNDYSAGIGIDICPSLLSDATRRVSAAPARFIRTYQVPPTGRLGEAMPELLQAAHAARLVADLDEEVVHDHSLVGPLAAGRSPRRC